MSELIIIIGAIIVIVLLYVIERAVVFFYKLKRAEQYQAEIVAQERHLFNRLTLLLALDQPIELKDPLFQKQRKVLYDSPRNLDYHEINAILDKSIKSPTINQTLKLGLVAETKGLADLIDLKVQEYREFWDKINTSHWMSLSSLFCHLFKKRYLTNQNFQKSSKVL